MTTSSDVDESDYKDFTVNRSTGSCTNSKSSVAIIYPCYLCNYETYRSTSLVAHLRQHTQGNLTLETERLELLSSFLSCKTSIVAQSLNLKYIFEIPKENKVTDEFEFKVNDEFNPTEEIYFISSSLFQDQDVFFIEIGARKY